VIRTYVLIVKHQDVIQAQNCIKWEELSRNLYFLGVVYVANDKNKQKMNPKADNALV